VRHALPRPGDRVALVGTAEIAVVLHVGPKRIRYRDVGSELTHNANLQDLVPLSLVRRHPAWRRARDLRARANRLRDEAYKVEDQVDKELEKLESVYEQSPWRLDG